VSEHVEARRDGGVLILRLARPEKKNALTAAMYGALIAAFDEADGGDEIGAILLAGSGGAFTAGNDIADFLALARDPGSAPPFRFVRRLARLDTPLVAAVEGVAVGIGATLLLHSDLAYAAPSALFRMPFVDLGLVPEAGSSLLLPRRVGLAKASELLMLAEPFGAEEALRLGLVNAVVPADELITHALSRAQKLAAKPREAIRTTRRLLRGDRAAILDAIDAEAEAFLAALRSPAAQAALQAFLAKFKAAAAS
jgi:enoyl-CoA hydratase/carnithine racemase